MAGGAAIAGAALGPLLPAERAMAQTRTVYVNTWGGSWTAAEDAAFFKPFTQATGIAVRTVAPVSYAKLKAQVASGNYEWDVGEINQSDWLRAEREGLVEPIDWTIVQQDKLFPGAVSANGISYCALGTNLCYRKDKFPNGGPRSWADFWDVEKFPGTRSLYNSAPRTLMFALLAERPRRGQFCCRPSKGSLKTSALPPIAHLHLASLPSARFQRTEELASRAWRKPTQDQHPPPNGR
jgi:putative spermidine/putrescine transport system substrate-binding protein